MQIEGHEHDGVRRWLLHYRNETAGYSQFLSDAVTMMGAEAHFKRSYPGKSFIYIRHVDPDKWLNRL